MKKSLFLSLLLIGGIALVGCKKSGGEPEAPESKYPVAEQVCVDNGGVVTKDDEGTPICLLGGRGINLADMEENPEALPEGSKTSLTNEELDEIAETNFPKGYTSSTYNLTTQESTYDNVTYPDNISHTLLIPEHATMAVRKVLNSGIQDGMIYTLTDVILQDGTVISVLYIVDPVTLDFVAANVENGDIITNYQFTYSVQSLTYADLEEIAKSYFPTSNTYTVFNMETQETSNGETLYHENTPHNLVNITPDFAPIKEQTLLSSGIEDGMIYTNFDVTYDNGTTGNVLYINNPETLNFVAATVESEGMSVNYQFAY